MVLGALCSLCSQEVPQQKRPGGQDLLCAFNSSIYQDLLHAFNSSIYLSKSVKHMEKEIGIYHKQFCCRVML